MEFKKAERKAVKLKLAMSGPSGSGKTYSALKIAKGLGGKIALIDTENGSASLYADMEGIPEFSVIELGPPFTTQKYIDAIHAAIKGEFDVLIIDSITHQWAAEGGILDRSNQAKIADPKGNSFTQWAKFTPEHEKFKQAILQSEIHLIATMRSKTDYAMVENDKGRMVPKKMGFAPVQREGMEYEFTIVFDMQENHTALTSKDRTGLFGGEAFYPTQQTGSKIKDWLLTGKQTPPSGKKIEDPGIDISEQKPTKLQLKELFDYSKLHNKLEFAKEWFDKHGLKGSNDLSMGQYVELMADLSLKQEVVVTPIETSEPQQPAPWEAEAAEFDPRVVK